MIVASLCVCKSKKHYHPKKKIKFFFKLCSPFLWMGFNCLKATEPRRGSSFLFTAKFTEIPGTNLIDLGRMKVCTFD